MGKRIPLEFRRVALATTVAPKTMAFIKEYAKDQEPLAQTIDRIIEDIVESKKKKK